MKKYFRFIISAAVLVGIFSVSVFALTENEVHRQRGRYRKYFCLVSMRGRIPKGIAEDRQLYVLARNKCRAYGRVYVSRGSYYR